MESFGLAPSSTLGPEEKPPGTEAGASDEREKSACARSTSAQRVRGGDLSLELAMAAAGSTRSGSPALGLGHLLTLAVSSGDHLKDRERDMWPERLAHVGPPGLRTP